MISTLVFAFGVLFAVLFFGALPVLLALGVYHFQGLVGTPVLLGSFLIAIVVLYAALVWFRRSLLKALADLGALGLAATGWAISKFATAIRRLGSLLSFMSWIKAGLGFYPGRQFIEKRREDLIQRGVEHYERGNIEINESPETLAQEARQEYDKAGRRLSNGEAILGIALAGVLLLPSNASVIPITELLNSQIIGSVLSISLVLVVALRLSALDMVLVRDPSVEENLARLAGYREWNRTMTSGAEVVKSLLMFRAMHSINESAYDFYLDWVFERNINGEGVGLIEVIHEVWRPLFAFHIAERDEMTPTQASRELFGWNVFSEFRFGPGAEDPVPEQKTSSRIDSVLHPIINLKHDVRDIRRTVQVYKFAEEKDLSPEEASIELYDENILPQTVEHTEDEEK